MRADTHFKRIHIEKDAAGYGLTSRILKRLNGLPVVWVNPEKTRQKSESLNEEKETLRLLSFRGKFLKSCPGTKGYICCGYKILHIGTNCPLDCSYCILQAYLNHPSLRIFVNIEDELDHIGQIIDSNPAKIFRIGTGEFTDSLSLDHIIGFTDILLPFFSSRKNAILELKTKTERIEGLISSKYREQIVVSWSLNSPIIASREEHGAPAIKKRLLAARKCQAEGYILGFHFDPLIEHPNWKEGYKRTLEMMDNYIDPKGIIWVSLGSLRYMPALKTVIRQRYPNTDILNGEFVHGLDGKMRYFKPIRIDMYSFLGEILNKWHQDLGFYLCMESDEVWQKSLGWSPGNSNGLSHYLDKRVREMFGK